MRRKPQRWSWSWITPNWKTVCAVLVELLLTAHFPMLALPRPQDDLPEITKIVLVICSSLCFFRPVLVKQLLQARALGVGVIRVIAETSFQFPTHAWCKELTDVSHSGVTPTPTDLTILVKIIFQEIAVHVEVQDSEHALQVRGEAIAKRLSFGLRPLSDDADLPSKSHSVASLTPAPQSSRVTIDITDESVTDDLEGITLEFFEPQETGEPCPTNTRVEEITDAP